MNRLFGEVLGRRAASDFEPSCPILCDLVRRERPPKSSALFNFLADVGGVGMSCVSLVFLVLFLIAVINVVQC